MTRAKRTPDLTVANDGSIVLLRPLSPEAEAWLEANVDPEAQRFV